MKFTKKDIGLFIFLTILLAFFVYTRVEKKNIRESNYILVNDASTFFTVDGCVDKYVYALSSLNSENVLNLLSNTYKLTHFITNDNILEKLNAKEGMFEFKAKKMYSVEIDKTYTKYYVYGLLSEEVMDEYIEYGSDFYVIVTINNKEDVFTIEPYNETEFRGIMNANNQK